jgi:molecular chaperone GrpE
LVMPEEKDAKTQQQENNEKPESPTPEAKADETAREIEKLLETEKKRSQEFLTRLQYLQADYDNQRKRFDREVDQIKTYCSERIVTQLLDVVDELELAIKACKDADGSQKALLDGVEMTYRRLRKVLEQESVTPIECTVGKVFDPHCQDAIAAEERDDVKECTVIDEIRKGYLLREKVLRPAIVRVVKPKSK